MTNARYSGISLFAGCGGSDLGMAEAGIDVVWANDRDEGACQLYESITGREIEHADIRKIDSFPTADILCGCYPCQGYSQGGRRDEDASINFLYREFDRVLRKVRPLAFIVENVDGMRFSQNRSLLRSQIIRFRAAGYLVNWKVLDAKDYGLAQDRKRLFIVGIRSRENLRYTFPEPTHGAPQQSSYRTLRDVIWHLRDAPSGSFCEDPFHWYYMSRNRRRGWDEQARCVVAHWRHVGLHPDSPPLRRISTDRWLFDGEGYARRLSYFECAALQGFVDTKRFTGLRPRRIFRAIGNAVPPPLFAAVAANLTKQIDTLSQNVP
ncbi:MAG: DNA cytosine methyltransferase [bacterium]|nr:DNA cytosine methyltransferase [bacterium]